MNWRGGRRFRCATVAFTVPLVIATGCSRTPDACARCDTLIVAALGEPTHLLPPFYWQGVARDIGDLVFERLAVLDPARSPLDSAAYRPGLATRWERLDSLTWLFHLRDNAQWNDGRPVTADDVVFSFVAHQDPALDAAARLAIADLTISARNARTVQVSFPSYRPDQLYDASYHVRIFSRQAWDSIPVAAWAERGGTQGVVGSGPYRVAAWQRGISLTLEAVAADRPVQRIVWLFAADPETAANLVLTGEADLLEALPNPRRRDEFARAPHLRLVPHASAVYGFLGFNLANEGPWTDVRVRRALRLALDRETMAQSVLGAGTAVPDGPLSAQLWLWEPPAPALPDSAAAAALLDSAGWVRGQDGRRRRAGRPLAIDILVPGTSAARRDLAIIIQERWRRHGVAATVTQTDFPVFQERLAGGRFETMIGAWYDEPNPRSLADQWSRSGWGALNYGRYANAVFDSLLQRTVTSADTAAARRWWREALDTLNADAPAIWLYTPTADIVMNRRLREAEFQRFSWLLDLPQWRLAPPEAGPL